MITIVSLSALLLPYLAMPFQGDKAPVRSRSSVRFVTAPNGAPIVDVTIDKHVRARLAIDTGTNISFVSSTLASKARLTTSSINGLDGKPLKVATIGALTVGEMPFVNGQFLVVESAKMESDIGRDIDGILGANAFGTNALQIDYTLKKVTLWTDGAMTPSDIEAAGFASVKPLDVRIDSRLGGMRPFVSVQLDGRQTVNMLIDTGSAMTAITPQVATSLAIAPIRRVLSFKTLSGASDIPIGVIHSVQLGDNMLNDLEVRIPSVGKETDEPLLGNDVLQRHYVLLDLTNKRLYLKPIAVR
jgi:hypothetical protein